MPNSPCFLYLLRIHFGIMWCSSPYTAFRFTSQFTRLWLLVGCYILILFNINQHCTIMTTSIPISKARTNLGAIVKKIRLGKGHVILEKDGYPIVGIMDIDEFEDYLDARNAEASKYTAKSRLELKAGRTKPASSLLS